MNPSPVNSCSGNFFDSGGSFNRYGNNEDIIKTICPSGTSGTHIELQFLTTDFGAGDNLCIYDGMTIASPEILCTINDIGNQVNGAFKVSASAPNSSGCLTLRFTSDGAGTGPGWESVINCVPACQRIIAELASTSPAVEPADNGWIDICPGDNVNFIAQGNYPQNSFSYFQSDATSTFSWDFGDGTIGFGPNVTHTYQRSGGYTVQLVIEDSQGCTNDNVLSQRVRVATKPTFDYNAVFPDQVCSGDTLVFLNNINQSDSYLTVTPSEGQFNVRSGNVDSIPLPDGVNVAYESPVTFSEFIPGAVITNVDQIKNICINIEHSYLRDLDISIRCPNGEIMRLDTTNANFTLEMFLGIPYEADDDIPGNLDPPIPGIGFTYCFTPTPQYGTFFDQALTQAPRTSLPEGNYKPIDDFNTLLGCPVNGEWSLIVEDKIKRDNGWLFSWSICFADELRPEVETFTPAITDWGFLDNGTMLHNDQDSMVTVPSSAGTTNYVFQITDEFGCVFDTTLSYSVVAPTDPSCFECDEVVGDAPDEDICENESVQLMIEYLGFDENTIPFENNTETEFGNGSNPPSSPLESEIAVAGASPAVITNPVTDIASVCIDIDTDATGDLQIYLEAPSGKVVELTTNNGGTGDHFRNTCFTADTGLQNITAASPPYTGNFLPEGSFDEFIGEQVNGKWILTLSDAFGPLDINVLNSWSISFNVENTPEYSWTPTQGLSCTDCPDPEASPNTTTEYIVTVSDDFGCVGFDTILVTIVPDLEAPIVSVEDPAPGVLVFEWTDVPNAIGYEVNVNNGGWFPPNNGNLSHFVTGLSDDDPVNFMVRGITDTGSCAREIANVDVIYGACLMTVEPTVVREISCFGAADAAIAANVMNASPPVMYTLDGTTTQSISIFNNIGPGIHDIVVEDDDGCIDTVYFDLVEPDQIVITASAVDVTCQGANDGQLIATAVGGVGDLSFLWATVPTTFSDTATGQGPGTYTVEVTDEMNCRATETATINEPDPMMVTLLGDEPSCNGGTNGSIMSTVTGGEPPYNYVWDIPAFTADVMVGAGNYTLTVTDVNMCDVIRSIQITEPAPEMATAVGTDASCHNTTDGTATIDLVGSGPFTFLWDDPAMQTTQTAVDLSPGVYNFTLTESDGCNSVGFVGIGAPAAVQSSTSSTRTACFGGDDGTASVIAVGGVTPYVYLWNDPGLQTTSVATGLEAGDYEVVITDGRGCTILDTATVGSAAQIETVVDSTFASCIENADGSATVFPIGGTGTYSFAWDDDMSQMTSTASDLSVGIYTVTVTDTNNCSVTDTVEVIAGDPVRIDSLLGTMPSCFGDRDGQLVGFISGGEAPYDYEWDDPNGQFENPATNLLSGDYILTVTDVNGCTAVGNITLNQPNLLEIELSAQQIDCFEADNGIITAEVTGGTYPYTYTLDNVFVNDSIIENLAIGIYTVEVTDQNNCTADAMIEITQPAEPLSFTLIQVDTSCVDANMSSAQVIAVGGTGPDYSYEWSANNSIDNPFIDDLSPEMLYVTVTDENLCTLVDSILIVEYDSIIPRLITSRPSCNGFPDGLIAVNTISGGAGQGIIENYDYSWEGYPAETSHILNNVPGDMFYTVTVTDAQGCSAIVADSILQPRGITLDIDKQNPSCFGAMDGVVRINAVNGDNPVDTYEWSTGPADIGNEITQLSGGNYIVTVTDTRGCSVVTSINLNEPPILTGSLDVTNNVCAGDADGEIQALPVGGTPPFTYLWSNTQTTQTIFNIRDGDYMVTITDANGCSILDSTTLTAPAAIMVDAEVVDITCFEGSDGRFTLTTSGGIAPYQYSYDGELFNSQNIRSGLETGAYPVTVMDNQGCSWDSIIQIGTVPQFQIFAGEDQFIDIGDSISLTATLFNAFGTTEIIWSSAVDFDLTCTECISTTVSPLNSTTYEVYGIDNKGCDANDFVEVFVARRAQIMVPTGFTPNADGNNDILVVHGKSKNIIAINSFMLYDRWGETVYERNNFDVNDRTIGWDGTFRGKEMEAGTYIWTLQVQFENGETQNLQGATTLIR